MPRKANNARSINALLVRTKLVEFTPLVAPSSVFGDAAEHFALDLTKFPRYEKLKVSWKKARPLRANIVVVGVLTVGDGGDFKKSPADGIHLAGAFDPESQGLTNPPTYDAVLADPNAKSYTASKIRNMSLKMASFAPVSKLTDSAVTTSGFAYEADKLTEVNGYLLAVRTLIGNEKIRLLVEERITVEMSVPY